MSSTIRYSASDPFRDSFDDSTADTKEERINMANIYVDELGSNNSDDEGDRESDLDGDEDDDFLDSHQEDDNEFTPFSTKRFNQGSKRTSSTTSAALSTLHQKFGSASHPCRVLITILVIVVIVAIAVGLLSLLDLNKLGRKNNGQDNDESNFSLMNPPPGAKVDTFQLSNFTMPPWTFDLSTYVPFNITNGLRFAEIVWGVEDGLQYVSVNCPVGGGAAAAGGGAAQQSFRYHFSNFENNRFEIFTGELLPMGEANYVFVSCDDTTGEGFGGLQNYTNVVFREIAPPPPQQQQQQEQPRQPVPLPTGTLTAPQPMVDDVVMLLVDAVSRAKFMHELSTVYATLQAINQTYTQTGTGHRIFDFEHYNVLGQNSPPNKAYIYAGQNLRQLQRNTHWLWDVFQEQGFVTAHTDGECGGSQGILDYTTGAITFEYARYNEKIPAQYQMDQTVWCKNHQLYGNHQWGRSCRAPAENEGKMNYDADLMGGMRFNTGYCAGDKAIHEFIMEDLKKWLESQQGQRRFATYSFMDDHSPDHNHISFDQRLSDLVQDLLIGRNGKSPLLTPNSVLIVMADHGLHYGPETYTFPGFLHHKIPPLFMALPPSLFTHRPEILTALEANQKAIMSHIDLHLTFLQLAYGDRPSEDVNRWTYTDSISQFLRNSTFREQIHPPTTISEFIRQPSESQLFGYSVMMPIPQTRTCAQAGIPHDFCAFQPFLELNPFNLQDTKFMRQVVLLISKKMNDLAIEHHVQDICRPWSMVLNSLVLDPSTKQDPFSDIMTLDLKVHSGFASALSNEEKGSLGYQSRIFYFMFTNVADPETVYSTMLNEDEVLEGNYENIQIVQQSAYAAKWSPCDRQIKAGGKGVGRWEEVMKHFCVC